MQVVSFNKKKEKKLIKFILILVPFVFSFKALVWESEDIVPIFIYDLEQVL